MSDVCNILACMKSWVEVKAANSAELLIHIASDILKSVLDNNNDSDVSECAELIRFLVEQVNICFMKPSARHYSPQLIMNSFLWNMTSPRLYTKLQEFFYLPTQRRLRQLSCDLTVKQDCINLDYLQNRLASIAQEHRICLLLIDEIYTAKKIEYTNGSFVGVTEDGEVAKTVLAFLIQSVCCKYRDIVILVPTDCLTSEVLKIQFNKVMSALAEIKDLFVCGVSTDNAAVNR